MGGCGQTCSQRVATLNGVLTCSHAPRSSWWVYQLYSELRGMTVQVEQGTRGGTIDAVAAVSQAEDGGGGVAVPAAVRVLVTSFPRCDPLPLPHDSVAPLRNITMSLVGLHDVFLPARTIEAGSGARVGKETSVLIVETRCIPNEAGGGVMHPSGVTDIHMLAAPQQRPALAVPVLAGTGSVRLDLSIATQEVCLLEMYLA